MAIRTMFLFEDYTLDVARGSLRTKDREMELRPKSFEVLCYLVENAGRLVTKEELLNTVWPNVVVTEESLSRCVSDVRKAIDDSHQKIIKTVPGRGYRFAAPVSREAGTAKISVIAGALGADTSAGSDAAGRLEIPIADRPSIAVLPFANFSGDPQQEYFCDGITEDVITELSRFSELSVIARNSTFRYKNKTIDIRQIGRELGARYVLEGSIRRDGNRVRINAQLIDAASGAHRWAERYDRELTDVFAVQDEVACTIAAILAAHVNKAETERALLKPPATWEAYEYYLRSTQTFLLYEMSRRTKASLYEARRLLEQSLAIDPNYARAYAMLSWTFVYAYIEPVDDDYINPAAIDRAHALAETAVHLDVRLPQAHAQLGWVLLWKRKHDAAIAEFEEAVTLNPNFVDNRIGHVLTYAGQPAKAVEVLRSNTRLDPFQSPVWLTFMGHAYYMLKCYDDAIRSLRECAARMPNSQFPHVGLAASYAQLKQLTEAKVEAKEVLRINPGFTIEKFKGLAVYKEPTDLEHRLEGLCKAGLPRGLL
jgi:adenylate cyclase